MLDIDYLIVIRFNMASNFGVYLVPSKPSSSHKAIWLAGFRCIVFTMQALLYGLFFL